MQARTQDAKIAIVAPTIEELIKNPGPVLSDSPALITQISSEDRSFTRNILTWDIMAQGVIVGTHVDSGTNNKLGLVESDTEYEERLARVGRLLGHFLKTNENHLAIVNLQNVPADPLKRKIFLDAIKREVHPSPFWNLDFPLVETSKEVGLLSLFNTNFVDIPLKRNQVVREATIKGIHTAQITDFTLKGQNPNEGIAVRTVNGVFDSDPKAVESALNTLDNLYNHDSQTITSGIFGTTFAQLDKTGTGENYIYQNANGLSGFHFKYNPATYKLTQLGKRQVARPSATPPPSSQSPIPKAPPQQPPSAAPKGAATPQASPTAQPKGGPAPAAGQPSAAPQGPSAPKVTTTAENITKKISWSEFTNKFAQSGYKVERTNNTAKVINVNDEKEFVQVNKITEDKVAITASKVTPKNLDKLVEVAKEIYDPGTVVSIEVHPGNPPLTVDQVQSLKDELWLKAVNSHLTVKGHTPSEAFLLAHDKDVPDEYKKKASVPGASPSPSS